MAWYLQSVTDSVGRASRTADVSMAWRRADTAWGMGATWTAWRASSTETSGSADNWFSLSAARAWARAVLLDDTAWFRDTRASTPSPMATAVTATLTPEKGALSAGGGPPAGQDVLVLQCGGCRVGVDRRPGQPALRRLQLAAAEEEAPVAPFGLPLEGFHQPAGVLLAVLEVGVDGVDQSLEGDVVVVGLGERDPVALSDLLGDVGIRHRAPQDGHDALLEGVGVVDLLLAELRRTEVRADHEEKRIRTFDGGTEGRREDLRIGDVGGVDPNRLAPALDRCRDPLDELGVST